MNNPLANAIEAGKALYAAGFRGGSLVTALAIAGAESGFRPNAIGDVDLQDNKWGPSVGYMQIRSLKPAYLHLEPIRNYDRLFDPYYNAKAAWQISKQGTDFKPWTTFTSQAFQGFWKVAQEALETVQDVKKKVPLILLLAVLVVGILWILK